MDELKMIDLYDEQGYIDSSEVEEILHEMQGDEFLKDEIESQISDGMFDLHKNNIVVAYLGKYKKMKKLNCDDRDIFLQRLKENKEDFLESVVENLSSTFDFGYDSNKLKPKHVRTLYEFFVMDYRDNIIEFFINMIDRNQKYIIRTLKDMKFAKDIGTTSSNAKYADADMSMMINKIVFIMNDMIPSLNTGEDFIDYILCNETVTNSKIQSLIDHNIIDITSDTYDKFIEPYLDQSNGSQGIVYDVLKHFVGKAYKKDMALLED